MSETWTGGCQCGAVRFRALSLGRASLCHCRMCQKAFGGIGGLLVSAHDLTWTRGAPDHFASSNRVRRGFCGACGTPLTFEPEGGAVDVAIAAFDRADEITPTIQLAREARLACFDALAGLPDRPAGEAAGAAAWYGSIVSHQHPDQDTQDWQVKA
ncbi:MAG: GFA family protein [Hyphomicrobiaceae bacterium]